MSKKHFVEKKLCRGFGPRVGYPKNQLPRQKTLAKNFVRNVTIFRPEKTKKNGIIRSKIICFKKFKKLSRGIWPRIPHAKNQLPTLKIVGQSLWERKYDFHRKPEVVFEFDKNWKRNHFNLMQRQYI